MTPPPPPPIPDLPAPSNLESEIVCRIIGLGGIGQVVAVYLGRFLGSLPRPSRLVLIDGDRYEPGNEARMHCPAYGNKAEVLRDALADSGPTGGLTLLAVPEYAGAGNLARLLRPGPGESILLCVDNHSTRKLVAEHAAGLDDVCLISGGNDGVGPDAGGVERQGTAGNVQVHLRRGGRDLSPPLTAYHPEIARPADHHPDEAGCAALAAGASPQIIFTNVTAAAAMMNAWYAFFRHGAPGYAEVVFDTRAARMAPLALGGAG